MYSRGAGVGPRMYPPARNLSLDLVMRLWDVYLAVNDPSLVFFLLAALLVRNRYLYYCYVQAGSRGGSLKQAPTGMVL